jgi:hypothetical protein
MAALPQMWALTTETPGGVEEAHRRWPEGRSERGASKAKHRPPVVFRGVLPGLRIGRIMDSKIIYLGHAQRVDRVVWVAVPSESNTAPPVVEKWDDTAVIPPRRRRSSS